MINWNINPEIINIFGFSVRYYGLIYVLGFIITLFYLDNLRKKQKLELSKDSIYDLIFYLIIGVIIGARTFEVLFWNPGYYFSHLLEIFMIWNGGLSFHGGLLGAFVVVYLFSKKHKISLIKLADILIIPGTLAIALGRLGNLFNSEIYGKITNVSWCFNFNNVESCRHPYQIYSFLLHLVSFFILLRLSKKQNKEGRIFFIGILLFGLVRFILDFWRDDIVYYGLTLGQYFSTPLILIPIYYLIKK